MSSNRQNSSSIAAKTENPPVVNKALFRKIRAEILKRPERLLMNVWLRNLDSCGSVGCIGGLALELSGKKKLYRYLRCAIFGWENDAARVLGLKRLQARRLFYLNRWPLKLWRAYRCAEASPPELRHEAIAKVVASYLDRFINGKAGRS